MSPGGADSSAGGALIPRFRRARRDPALAVLEGFHALKHALRFHAPLLEIVVSEEAPLERLSAALACARFCASCAVSCARVVSNFSLASIEDDPVCSKRC